MEILTSHSPGMSTNLFNSLLYTGLCEPPYNRGKEWSTKGLDETRLNKSSELTIQHALLEPVDNPALCLSFIYKHEVTILCSASKFVGTSNSTSPVLREPFEL